MQDQPLIAAVLLLTLLGLTCGAVSGQTPRSAGKSPASAPLFLDEHPELIAAMQQGWGETGINTAAHAPDRQGAPLKIRDRDFARGIGSHAPGTITLELNGRFSRFESWIGVQWQQGQSGSVVFQIYADGKKRFDSGVMRETTPARRISLSVRGVEELQLKMTDAGDGITCDVANWCEARLIPDANAPAPAPQPRVNIAPFALVVSSDPARHDGARNSRVEEFRADELFLDREVMPEPSGIYEAPVWQDGRACIGLMWLERRRLTEIGLEFDGEPPSAEGVEAQQWVMKQEGASPGGSRWQGDWQPLKGSLTREGRRWSLALERGAAANLRGGTLKIRWIFPASAGRVRLRGLTAFSDSRWRTTQVRLTAEKRAQTGTAVIEVYNGEMVTPTGAANRAEWSVQEPLTLTVRYCTKRAGQAERTVLRVRMPDVAAGIAVDDLMEQVAVYSRDFGIFATRLPAPITLEEYHRKIARRKTILERVRRMPDQTLEQAVRRVHRPEADHGPTMLSLPCHNRKFIVERTGVIQFGPQPDAYPYRFAPQFGSGKPESLVRALQGGWLPITTLTLREGSLLYHQRTFVAPAAWSGRPGEEWRLDQKSICVAEIQVTNTGANIASADLTLRFQTESGQPLPLTPSADPSSVELVIEGRVVAVIRREPSSAQTIRLDEGALRVRGAMNPGERIALTVLIPDRDAAPGDIGAQYLVERLAADTETLWRRLMEPAMQVELPDTLLQNVIHASQVHCLLAARNVSGEAVAPWIASSFYGPLESEAQSVIRGMLFHGQAEFARRSLEFFLSRVNEAGYLTTGYTVLGTGWMLWTLGEYYRLTGDDDWLRGVAPTVARMCAWIREQRKKTRHEFPRGHPTRESGLMPPGVIADWEVYACYYYANGCYYAGLESAGHALQRIGHPDAQAIRADARAYREDILRSYREIQSLAPLVPLQNGDWVPYYPTHAHCPGPIELFYPGEDGGRSWCYDVEIGAHHLLPMGVMEPESPQIRWIMEHMEDVQFLRDGWGYYPADATRRDWFNLGGFARVQPYYARTTECYALQDDVKPFIRSYYNALVSLLNREDLSLWEHFFNGAYNKTHETGYFLHQSRLMLAMERGDTLWLAPFITDQWLKDGQTVAARNIPTRFGSVSYRLTSHIAQGYIEASIHPPMREIPSKIVLRLRHPSGKRIRSVTVNGSPHADFDPKAGTVTLSAGREPISAQIRY